MRAGGDVETSLWCLSFSQISHLRPAPTAQPVAMGGSLGNDGEPGPLATRDGGSARPTRPALRGRDGEVRVAMPFSASWQETNRQG